RAATALRAPAVGRAPHGPPAAREPSSLREPSAPAWQAPSAPEAPPTRRTPEPPAVVADEPEAALAPNMLVHVDVRKRFKVRMLHVVIGASSDVRWQPSRHVLVLERGSLEIGADHYDAPATIDLERKHAPSPESVADLLARARAQFVAKDYRGAEATVRTLLARTLSR